MMKSLDQEIFDKVFGVSASNGYITQNRLPEESSPANPFVVIGEVQITSKKTNSKLLGKAFVTMNVWGTKRKEVSNVVQDLTVLTRFLELNNHYLTQDINASYYRVREDTSTPSVLWRGMIFLEFFIK